MSVGDQLHTQNANWNFKGPVADHFEAHVSRSVPFYAVAHDLVAQLSDYFIKADSRVYDLGCSTGTLLALLAHRHAVKPDIRLIGLDAEPDMIARAATKAQADDRLEFQVADLVHTPLDPTDLITALYTLQFIPPASRQRVMDGIYASLNWGGALIHFEKVRGPDARFQDILTGLYTEFKLEAGYTASEIMEKSRSLKGVLEPFSTQGNLDLLHRAGFRDVMTVFKYGCFEGFLAIK